MSSFVTNSADIKVVVFGVCYNFNDIVYNFGRLFYTTTTTTNHHLQPIDILVVPIKSSTI